MERYNVLFVFLLRVRRVQLQLQQCWALQMHRRHLRCCTADDQSAPKWTLRNHMAFLIDNLQYYLQVDVIESQFSILLSKVQSTRDFEAIRLAHDQFLSSLYSRCFLHMKPVSHCLSEILELCHSFCGLMSHSEVILSVQEVSQLDNIATRFQRQSGLLFKVLSSVRSHQTSPHLAQLLLRIDYNKFFTMACGQLPREGSNTVQRQHLLRERKY
jgi:gamma-tubulin complex component 4